MPQSVITALEELISIQQQLIVYADEKKTILIDRRIDDLNELVQQEARLVRQLNQADDKREQAVTALMGAHPSLRFHEFIDRLPDEIARKNIQSRMKTLQELLVELQAKNKINEQLLKDAMEFVHHMIEEVTRSRQQQYNYQSPHGQQTPPAGGTGFFDTKA
ncbi:flagellar protein FlgN [Planococcus lenghuensis]|uniref:Flagellar protein FlgN n=1 Tax=Planococcus lenghuensis TaxID=2213202 RepID=A0A1Q2L139_9BACL|nr:flagellar protein FlgN [Planococcus lenghuensis]AQQ54141.1 flagellar protein FlgN [Planococcus lenghuensis]